MSSSIGTINKISWHGWTASNRALGHGWEEKEVSIDTNYYVATFFANPENNG